MPNSSGFPDCNLSIIPLINSVGILEEFLEQMASADDLLKKHKTNIIIYFKEPKNILLRK